ncbi:hypothetical protein IQ07DRAFT_102796 [Pyrenochaeta sp. DS3sAY3a]|nr:hypothetical protein IQ07DRAFT_102796 [Pyrenochaeta sp. DS3sAY3a]
MTSAFGFSVGDFISAAALIKKVADALKSAGGAANEYQHVVIELEGLDRALKAVAALKVNESNAAHANAIRGMALSCQIPLRQFLEGLQSYEPTLGSRASRVGARGAYKKTTWALIQPENVQKLRAVIGAKVTSINLLLNLQISESVSRLESQIRTQQNHVLAEVFRIREDMGISNQRTQVLMEEHNNVMNRLDSKADALSAQIEVCSDQIAASRAALESSVVSVKNIGRQILSFINSFPREIRSLLQKILRTNIQTYYLLLHFQNNLTSNPSFSSGSNICFEDALGRSQQLPYEWFKHWETFEGLLRAEFHGLPGESKVTSGDYHLISRTGQTQFITKENWRNAVFPGSSLVMSMIMKQVAIRHLTCPRPSCKRRLEIDRTTTAVAILW